MSYKLAKTRWGRINLLQTFHRPLMLNGPDGQPYVADTHGGPLVMLLRCDCGHEWEVEATAFPGRRQLRSCGRFPCPFTVKPKLKRARGSSYSIYMAGDRAAQVTAWGAEKGLSFSKALDEIVGEYFLQKFLDED